VADKETQKSKAAPDDDTVGYGRPPKHSQFAPGRSGNPKGRPRKIKGENAITELFDEICGKATVRGQTRALSGLEAMFRGLLQKGVGGNVKAAEAILKEETTLMMQAAQEAGVTAKSKPSKGGLLVVPALAPSIEAWEAMAEPMQRELIEATHADLERCV
jgi:hypothetical protein